MASGGCVSMKKWDDAIHGGWVGVGASAVAAACIALIKYGAPQEALLSFLGALIGASATVAGAAWLADRNARVEQRSELGLLVDEFEAIEGQARRADKLAPPRDGPWSEEYRQELKALGPPLQDLNSICTEALDTAKRLTFRQRTRLREMQVASEQAWHFHEYCFHSEEENPFDERSWPEELSRLIKVAQKALVELRRAA